MPRSLALSGLVLGLALMSAGCPSRLGGDRTLEASANNLRAENATLRGDKERLSGESVALAREVEALRARLDNPPALPEINPADLPKLAKLNFGRYSGIIDTNRDGADDTLRLYLETLDRDDRFLLVAADVKVAAVAVSKPGQPAVVEPRIIAMRDIPPAEFRRLYRSGLTGTHFTIDIPLLPVAGAAPGAELPGALPGAEAAIPEFVTARLTLTDAATGLTLTHEQTFPNLSARADANPRP